MAEVRGDWVFSDAWVLAAIGTYRRPCSLVELVAAAERINESVPTEAELQDALGKLAGAGLVRVFEGWTFELTDEGNSMWPGTGRNEAGELQLAEAVLPFFEVGATKVTLPRGALDQAVQQHHTRFWDDADHGA